MLKRFNILLIEPSDLIADGLTALLEESGNFVISNRLTSIAEFNKKEHTGTDITIIDTISLKFDQYSEVRSIIPSETSSHIVALITTLPNNKRLHFFDSYFSIWDSRKEIMEKLLLLFNNEDTPDNKTIEDCNALSQREKEVLVAVATGLTNKEIADKLHLSIHTVTTHRKNISRKTGINSISGITVYAIINKLVDLHDL